MLSIKFLLQLATPAILISPLPGKHSVRDTTTNYIVLHYDDGNSYEASRKFLIKKGNSYHYYIKRNGTIVKMLDPMYEAGHAGLSYYKKHIRMNRYSIGICLQNNPPQKYTAAQYNSAAWLIRQLQKRYEDSTSKIILGHSEIAVPRGRKNDPGKHFNWKKLHMLIKHKGKK